MASRVFHALGHAFTAVWLEDTVNVALAAQEWVVRCSTTPRLRSDASIVLPSNGLEQGRDFLYETGLRVPAEAGGGGPNRLLLLSPKALYYLLRSKYHLRKLVGTVVWNRFPSSALPPTLVRLHACLL